MGHVFSAQITLHHLVEHCKAQEAQPQGSNIARTSKRPSIAYQMRGQRREDANAVLCAISKWFFQHHTRPKLQHLPSYSMDFLKNLKLDDSDKHEVKPLPVDHTPAPPAEQHDGSLFGKISSAISGDHHTQVAAPPPPPPTAPKHEGLFDKITGHLGGEHKATPPPPPPPVVPKHEGLFDKIGHALSGDKPVTPPPPPKEEGLLGKLSGALGGDHHAEAKNTQEGGLMGKLSGVLSGDHKEEPAKPQGLGDKINHALGGGAAGEKKEGKSPSLSLLLSY